MCFSFIVIALVCPSHCPSLSLLLPHYLLTFFFKLTCLFSSFYTPVISVRKMRRSLTFVLWLCMHRNSVWPHQTSLQAWKKTKKHKIGSPACSQSLFRPSLFLCGRVDAHFLTGGMADGKRNQRLCGLLLDPTCQRPARTSLALNTTCTGTFVSGSEASVKLNSSPLCCYYWNGRCVRSAINPWWGPAISPLCWKQRSPLQWRRWDGVTSGSISPLSLFRFYQHSSSSKKYHHHYYCY